MLIKANVILISDHYCYQYLDSCLNKFSYLVWRWICFTVNWTEKMVRICDTEQNKWIIAYSLPLMLFMWVFSVGVTSVGVTSVGLLYWLYSCMFHKRYCQRDENFKIVLLFSIYVSLGLQEYNQLNWIWKKSLYLYFCCSVCFAQNICWIIQFVLCNSYVIHFVRCLLFEFKLKVFEILKLEF